MPELGHEIRGPPAAGRFSDVLALRGYYEIGAKMKIFGRLGQRTTSGGLMRLACTVALHTGCRLRETALDMRLVDFGRRTITFAAPKGGRGRAFTRPLPKALGRC